MPNLTSVHSKLLEEGDHGIMSASALHKEAVSHLQEYLDMHANCVYLLDLYHLLGSLESAINQLCLCGRTDVSTLPESTEDLDLVDDFNNEAEDVPKDLDNKLYLEDLKEDIDEESYRYDFINK